MIHGIKRLTNERNVLSNISNKYRLLTTTPPRCSESTFNKTIDENPPPKSLSKKRDLNFGPSLSHFLASNSKLQNTSIKELESHPYVETNLRENQKVFFEVYGCQMNVSDAEIIWSILEQYKYIRTTDVNEADVVLLITCSIRDNAEQKIIQKLYALRAMRQRNKFYKNASLKIGVLGCMAERLKQSLLDTYKMVDVVAGPDAYKDLPRLLSIAENNVQAINVALSADETYADVTPVRLNPNSVSAYVTIMRGCDNMCTYCIVPFVRGRERSRPVASILKEVQILSEQGIKEITLLGQNVNSYRDLSEIKSFNEPKTLAKTANGFKTVYKPKIAGLRFDYLLDKVSEIDLDMRIRFTSPHPKDFPDEFIHLIASRQNICKQIHLPAQSGNSTVLERMRRGYTRESYLELVHHIREIIPDIKLSSDFIVGFCSETEEEFADTLTLMEQVQYHMAYMFQYSMREKTTAHRRFKDDVCPKVKLHRLQQLINLFRSQAEALNRLQIGTQQLVLIEKVSKRSLEMLQGRSDGNTRVLVPNTMTSTNDTDSTPKKISIGDYIVAEIYDANFNSLFGTPLYHSSITDYYKNIDMNIQLENK